MWFWIAVAAGVFTLVVAFAFARILGAIGREVAELHETTMWADWPTSVRRVSRSGGEVKEASRVAASSA